MQPEEIDLTQICQTNGFSLEEDCLEGRLLAVLFPSALVIKKELEQNYRKKLCLALEKYLSCTYFPTSRDTLSVEMESFLVRDGESGGSYPAIFWRGGDYFFPL